MNNDQYRDLKKYLIDEAPSRWQIFKRRQRADMLAVARNPVALATLERRIGAELPLAALGDGRILDFLRSHGPAILKMVLEIAAWLK